MARPISQTAKVFPVFLERPLEPLTVEPGYREALLIVISEGQAIGQFFLPALDVIPIALQQAEIVARFGERLWQQHLERAVRASLSETPDTASISVSVVVCTRDRTDDLRLCIESLLELTTPAHEILIVDNAPSDDSTKELCREYPVTYVLEPLPGQSRARNRGIVDATGELVAFTDDDVVVDQHWLDELAREFDHNLTMAVTGYVGPRELETPAQYLFELHGGFGRGFERRVFEGAWIEPALAAGPAGAGANSIFRRSVFEEVGLFSEDLGPGTPARAADDNDAFYRILRAGYRIVFDPSRIVWHSHRRDEKGLEKVLLDYTISSFAFVTRCLVRDRDWSALRIASWWWFHHFPADVTTKVRRWRGRLPLRYLLAEMRGCFLGPWRMWRSTRSRREIPPLEFPQVETPAAAVSRISVVAGSPDLSVTVPSHNRREMLGRVLDGLARQSYPSDRYEVVVVLDGSTDGSGEMVTTRETPYRLELVENTKAGIAAVRNTCIRSASNPIVLFLDDDIVPEPGCLAAHAEAHRHAPDEHVALGYCPPVAAEGEWWPLAMRAWWEDHFYRKAEADHEWTYVDFVTGNVSFPRDLVLGLGGFDEEFRSRHEDWELAIRLLQAGVRLAYYPDSQALHYADVTFAATVRHQRQEARDDVLLATKHPRVIEQLPLARYAAGRPAASEQFIRRWLPWVDRFERHQMRRSWLRATGRLVREAYVLGLRDAMPSNEDFLAFLAPVWRDRPAIVPLRLGTTAPVEVPPVGPTELAVRLRDLDVARISPIDPHSQWDWSEVTARVVTGASDDVRKALVEDALVRGDERISIGRPSRGVLVDAD